MTINLTLLVQMIHFCIAYYLIRLLLFQPTLAAIQKESATKRDIKNKIMQQQEQITQAEKRQQALWQQCRRYFAKHAPDIIDPELYVFRGIGPIIEPEVLSREEQKKLTTEVRDVLVEKVTHGTR